MSNQDLRLLALDGGGVRGLSALMILEQLMEAVNPDEPPKPCEFFDMIGGTSTGGHRVTLKGKIQGRFDSDELERAVKEVIREQGLHDDSLLKDTPESSCKVFVCATSKETSDTVCLTSYNSKRGTSDLLNSVRIWEACRATSAASSFFDPIAIGRYKEEFVDGALGANNPVAELWDQAQLMWGSEQIDSRVKCLVSIGTGVPSSKPFPDDVLHISEALVAIATETEQTAERFRRDKAYLDSSSRYFRFNVVRGLEDLGLEEATKAKEIAAATRRYVASQETYKQMQSCAKSLRDQNDEMSSDVLSSQMATFNPFLMPYPDIVTAAKDGDEELVRELLKKGANINAKGLDNLPALWWAAYKGYPEVLKLLIDTGKANPDFKDGYLKTPLIWACQHGHDTCVELLLQTGKVDINVKDRRRRTPLSFAAENGNEGVVELLLKTGKADLATKDSMHRTPLMWAIARKHDTVVKLIESRSS